MWYVIQILFTVYRDEELPTFSPYVLYAGNNKAEANKVYENTISIDEQAGYEVLDEFDFGSLRGGKKEIYMQEDETHYAHISMYYGQ